MGNTYFSALTSALRKLSEYMDNFAALAVLGASELAERIVQADLEECTVIFDERLESIELLESLASMGTEICATPIMTPAPKPVFAVSSGQPARIPFCKYTARWYTAATGT